MNRWATVAALGTAVWISTTGARTSAADIFRVATYNLEAYLDQSGGGRAAKSAPSRAKIREALRALRADVVALQEMSTTNALLELRAALKDEGLDYRHWEHVSGYDTNINVAVLSRFPITARRPHTNESYLLFGRRFRVSRAFLEVDVQVNSAYAFTLLTCHLKSRRPVPQGDEAEMREQEAILLRERIDARLKTEPDLNLVVLGDLNDVKNSRSTRAVIGRGRFTLVDTRPAERNGDDAPASGPRLDPRNITWTHYYGAEDIYSRIDYILLSPGMAREWLRGETYVLALHNWGVGSDHRPIVAGFAAANQ